MSTKAMVKIQCKNKLTSYLGRVDSEVLMERICYVEGMKHSPNNHCLTLWTIIFQMFLFVIFPSFYLGGNMEGYAPFIDTINIK